MKKTVKLSVHQLVDFLLRTGDIDTRVYNKATMSEGSRMHSSYQKKQSGKYKAEYFLSHTYETEDFSVTLEGRADGIIDYESKVVVEEVKTTVADLNEYADQNETWHVMQAACYGHMYALEMGINNVEIRLIYINQQDNTIIYRRHDFEIGQLQTKILELIYDYLDFYRLLDNLKTTRDESIKNLAFPFAEFRKGQRDLSKYVLGVSRRGGELFVEAPTGIGKTMSVLYPAVLSLEKSGNEKIFYVTAKNSGMEAAVKACNRLMEEGADFSYIVITAKDKICFTPKAACNPDECPFAKGYYDKIRNVLYESLHEHKVFDRARITDIARKYAICPFELQLDLALFVDVVICDYNYVFDPMVYLRRFFDFDAGRSLLLVDEAHNLVERSRDMYTAGLDISNYSLVKKSKVTKKEPKIQKALNKVGKNINAVLDSVTASSLYDIPSSFYADLSKFIVEAQVFMKEKPDKINDEFKDFFFEVNRFLKISEFMSDKFRTYVTKEGRTGTLVIRCLDSSALIKDTVNKLKGVVYFSATFSPIEYFLPSLGGNDKTPFLRLSSPFPVDNLALLVAPKVSTKYKKRTDTMSEVALYIELMVASKVGNYLVFFPSYKYLEDVRNNLKDTADYDLVSQSSDMTNADHEHFLSLFTEKPQKTTVGFAVLGGAFNEGIDLTEDRLIGVAIVGVGLPQLSFERDLISDYYKESGRDGYLFGYAYPGMNKVMQAVGRLIRSEKDRGVALLLDDRYLENRYREMFKDEWRNYQVVLSPDDLEETIALFWNNNRN